MKRFLILFALVCTTVGRAQEEPEPPSWYNVSKLAFVASGGTDRALAPIQYMMFTDETVRENEDLFRRYEVLLDEIVQEEINQVVPETIRILEEQMVEMRALRQELPELKEAIEEMEREFERQKREAMAQYVKPSGSYSYDPQIILRRLKAIAVNQKIYSGYWEAGNGLYCVNESPRYCSLDEDDRYTHTKITVAEKDTYKWGFIDENGRQVTPFQYSWVNVHAIHPDAFPDLDLIFVYKREPDGSVHAGAINYRGGVRIPFVYDENRVDVYHREEFVPFEKNGKIGLVSIYGGKEVLPFEFVRFKRILGGWIVSKDDKHYGMVSVKTGEPITPLKYSGLWSDSDPSFLRFDGKVDYYNEDGRFVRTEDVTASIP